MRDGQIERRISEVHIAPVDDPKGMAAVVHEQMSHVEITVNECRPTFFDLDLGELGE